MCLLGPAVLALAAVLPGGSQFPPVGKRFVADADLAAIAHPERLRAVVLRGRRGYGADAVTDAGLAHLVRCPNLRVLRAGGLGLTDRCLETVGKLPALEELALDSNALTGDGLHHLAGLRNLRVLHLQFNPLQPDTLVALRPLTGLTRLSVTPPAVDDDLLDLLGALANLEHLDLGGRTDAVTDVGLAHLATLPRLRTVRLQDCRGVTDAGLARLADLPLLESLALHNLWLVTPRGLDVPLRLPRLRHLELAGVRLDDAGVRAIGELADLETLLLWNVGDDRLDLRPLGRLRSLRTVRTNHPLAPAVLTGFVGGTDADDLVFRRPTRSR